MDKGTSYTGLALVKSKESADISLGDIEFILANYPCKNSRDSIPRKVPTKLLTKVLDDDSLELVAFGQEAQRTWKAKQGGPDKDKYLMFENFKKFLSPEERPPGSKKLQARAHNSSTWDLARVLELTFKAALECIKNRLKATVPATHYEEALRNLTWQITVPNLWDEYAKVIFQSRDGNSVH